MSKYIHASEKSEKDFYMNYLQKEGAIIMLNLLQFKSIADYSDSGLLKSSKSISGKEAYQIYTNNTKEKLAQLGSEILFYGESNTFLIGSESEKWDVVLLVKHKSLNAFMEFSNSKAYLNNAGHRTAGLEDSRLLPISELKNKFNPLN